MTFVFLVLLFTAGASGPTQMLGMEHCQAVAQSVAATSENLIEALCIDMGEASVWALKQ